MPSPKKDDFQRTLSEIFHEAEKAGKSYINIEAGELHRRVGGYPGPKTHRMPVCCKVMRETMHSDDEILDQPPSGQGARLRIRYQIPRQPT